MSTRRRSKKGGQGRGSGSKKSGTSSRKAAADTTQEEREALSQWLLERLGEAGRSGVALDELDQGHPADERTITAELESLQSAGEAVEWGRRWYRTSSSPFLVARVGGRLEGGLTEVERVDRPEQYVVRDRNRRDARRGDLVLIKRQRAAAGRRKQRREASIVRILSRGWHRLVGRVVEDRRGRPSLLTFEKVFDRDILVKAGPVPDDENVWVIAELEPSRPRHDESLVAQVVEVLGPVSEPGVDTRVVLEHFHISDEFSERVRHEAGELPEDPRPEDHPDRRDLREITLVTIDGATARDFDDAISVEEMGDGRYRVGVHIADVAEYVRPSTELDREARRRGTSVYFPERAVPMLPERISNGLCSLRPHVPRLALSVFLMVDESGEITSEKFCESLIESRARLTYDDVRDFLEDRKPAKESVSSPSPGQWPKEVRETLHRARDVMQRLHARREDRGSLDFDLPSGGVVLDPDGVAVGFEEYERHIAHRLIEELMIAANEAVARHLEEREVAAIFRRHDPPAAFALQELAVVLEHFGHRIDEQERQEILDGPKPLQRWLAELEDREEGRLAHALVLRAMQRAVYSPSNHGHYALASQAYCHFTSPIRRYPDLWNHRQLKRLLRNTPTERLSEGALHVLTEECSRLEQRAEKAERAILQWKKVRLIADRVGETFPGHITGVQPYGLFVQLDTVLVDGLVPVATMSDDWYEFDERSFALVGQRQGRRFQLGDATEVKLVGTSQIHRGLDLELADLAREPGARRRGQKGRQGRQRDGRSSGSRSRGSGRGRGGGRGSGKRRR